MADALPTNLLLTIKSARIRDFFPLLQQGFDVPALLGSTLANLLETQWQLTADYVTKRIATIFLEGHPVDDLTTAIIRENSVVALSGAMPGLVGATMRRDGFYANLRNSITYREIIPDTPARVARIRVKIFNILLPELGPDFLRRGVILGRIELVYFLENQTAAFWQDCPAAELNGAVVEPVQLCAAMHISGCEAVDLYVMTS
jgi:hypothetical protein